MGTNPRDVAQRWARATVNDFGSQELGTLAQTLDVLVQNARDKMTAAAGRRESEDRAVVLAQRAVAEAKGQVEAADDDARAAEALAAARDHFEQVRRSSIRSAADLTTAGVEFDRLAMVRRGLVSLAREVSSARDARAAKPLLDTDGFDERPDPLKARTAAELVDALRRYRVWAGEPPFRQMAALARQKVAHSTLYAALNSDELPRQEVVIAVIAGCGGGEEEQRRYVTAWRRIKFGTAEPEPVAGTPALRAAS